MVRAIVPICRFNDVFSSITVRRLGLGFFTTKTVLGDYEMCDRALFFW